MISIYLHLNILNNSILHFKILKYVLIEIVISLSL